MAADEKRIETHIQELSKLTATPGNGVTRLTYSKEDGEARNYIKERMSAYGLHVQEDGLGNIFGKLPGINAEAPSVLVGSHFDSVPNGGAYDGTAGVVAGLEVAALFQEHHITPTYPLEIIALVEEEGTRFGSGLMGSRGMVGAISDADFEQIKDDDGITAREAMNGRHLNPELPRKRDPKTMKAFLEMHIEQGPILEEKQIPIGVVESIVGLTQLQVTIKGQAGHAGTTPMERRTDALVTASKVIGQLPDIAAEEGNGTVITTGSQQVYPNGANVIPGKVVFTIDIRSGKEEHVQSVVEKTKTLLETFNTNGMQVEVEQPLYITPKALHPSIRTLLAEKSGELDIPHCSMHSGAGHDAMVLSDVTDVGMLFIPSKNGLSHCPEEWSDTQDIAKSVDILYEATKELTKGV